MESSSSPQQTNILLLPTGIISTMKNQQTSLQVVTLGILKSSRHPKETHTSSKNSKNCDLRPNQAKKSLISNYYKNKAQTRNTTMLRSLDSLRRTKMSSTWSK